MKPTVNVNQRDVLNLQEKLAMLALPPRKRVWILKTLGRWEKAKTRKRIQQQKDIHGQALAPKKGNKRGKVMRRMAKGLTPYVRNANTLDLTWSNPLTAKIAAMHHLGQKQKMTKRQMQVLVAALRRRLEMASRDAKMEKISFAALREWAGVELGWTHLRDRKWKKKFRWLDFI